MGQKPLRVFISYKWEDDAYNKWVEKFATDLRAAGFDAILDRWYVRLGDSFTEFMTSRIHAADVVLFIMTTASVAAAEAPANEGGAVKFEIQMATSRKIASEDMRLIGIYREGNRTVAYLRDHRYADFRDDSKYEVNFKELIDDLSGKDKRPPLQGRINGDYQAEPIPIQAPIVTRELDSREMSVLSAIYSYSLRTESDFIESTKFLQTRHGQNVEKNFGFYNLFDTIEYLAEVGYFDNFREIADNQMVFHGNGLGFETCAALLGFTAFDKMTYSAIRRATEHGVPMRGDELSKALSTYGDLPPIVTLYLLKVMKNRGWINFVQPMGTNAHPTITVITSQGKRAARP